MKFRSGLYYRFRQRAQNRLMDVAAVLLGYCNDCPWRPNPSKGGGYSFWRCALRRNHKSDHRSRNYTWGDDGRTTYEPIYECPSQPWDRSSTPTLRQARHYRHWLDQRMAQRGSPPRRTA